MKKLLKKFFTHMNKRYIKTHNLIFIPGSEYNYIYLDIDKYKGKPVTLSDGTSIKKGDMVIEIHVNNDTVDEVPVRKVIKVFYSETLALAKQLKSNDEFKDIKAIFGRTVLAPLTKRLGFDVFEMKSGYMKRFLKIWDNLIKIVFSSTKKDKVKFREPQEVWMSRDAIINKLGEK
ncbi:hypothetical protein SH1V18_08550 [Vallitalea longa]|uniref:YkoP-like domain-containing protein n=1 Tax=Vallitalea longa TaxID=2936439 RepID=A0A9W5Y7L1_9FIRM|nr:hypothetical protein [Vallitalea longa]GKX28375.1 hypothetical protein SH1V18_08550 [Vallitalea longa]